MSYLTSKISLLRFILTTSLFVAFVGGAHGQSTNVALLGAIDSFSAEDSSTYPAVGLIDGSTANSDRWNSGTSGYPHWIVVDLGANYDLDKVIFHPFDKRAYWYIVEGRLEGGSYVSLVDRSLHSVKAVSLEDTFSKTTARYVRLTVVGDYGYSGNMVAIKELEIYGVLNTGEIFRPTRSFGSNLVMEASTRVDGGLDLIGEGMSIFNSLAAYQDLINGTPVVELKADGSAEFSGVVRVESGGDIPMYSPPSQ